MVHNYVFLLGAGLLLSSLLLIYFLITEEICVLNRFVTFLASVFVINIPVERHKLMVNFLNVYMCMYAYMYVLGHMWKHVFV